MFINQQLKHLIQNITQTIRIVTIGLKEFAQNLEMELKFTGIVRVLYDNSFIIGSSLSS